MPRTQAERHYDITDVDGFNQLHTRIQSAETFENWADILDDYVNSGNSKIAKNVFIFNLGSAVDCPNLGTDHCQVPKNSCYAYKAETGYATQALAYRRRQEYLWDCITAKQFAEGIRILADRKRIERDTLRLSESGDFRHNADILKADKVAKLLADYGFKTYTYSASDYLNWELADHITINASNPNFENANRQYTAVAEVGDIPNDGLHCPYDKTDGDIQCGECNACITDDVERDIYITLH